MRNTFTRFLLFGLLTFGLLLFCTYFYFDLSDRFVFWVSIVLSSAALALIVTGETDKSRLAGLLEFAIVYHIAPLIRSQALGIASRLIYTRDEVYQEQLVSIIRATGTWQPATGIGVSNTYSFYPSLPILSTMSSLITGTNPGFVYFANIALPAITAILPIIFYLKTMRSILGNGDWAMLATCVFTLNEQFLFFDSLFSYESLAIVFFSCIMYLLSTRLREPRELLTVLMVAVLTLTHFWTDLNLILFLLGLFVLPIVLAVIKKPIQDQRARPRFSLLLIAGAAFAIYSVLVSTLVLTRYGGSILIILVSFIELSKRLTPQTTFRSGADIFFIVAGQAVLVVLGGIGFLRQKHGPPLVLKAAFLIGGLYLMTILFGLPASVARPILHRGFFFGFFAIAPIVAWTIQKSNRVTMRRLKGLLLILTVISVILIQEPWFTYPDFVATQSQIYAGRWAQNNIKTGSTFIAMRVLSDTFGAYGQMRDLDLREPFYSNESIIVSAIVEGRACILLKPFEGNYVGLSSNPDSWLSRYYIERYYPTTGQQYITGSLSSYSSNAEFDRIMNSGYVSLYYGC